MGSCCSVINKVHPNDKRFPYDNKFILGIIDPQNDFFESGSLAISSANEIIGPINKLRYNISDKINTFISLDTHHSKHISFASTHNKEPYSKLKLTTIMRNKDVVETEQTLWPDHCISNTPGHQIHQHLITKPGDWKIKKGTFNDIESYSAFGDENGNTYENTGLHNMLKAVGYTNIILVGLAIDYCVYYTALDALAYGYKVHIILSCVRGVAKQTTIDAIEDMTMKGVNFYEDVDDFLVYMYNYLAENVK